MRLIGLARLGNDAQLRYTPQGKSVLNLSLAYNFGKKDSDQNRKTQWVKASLWGDQAERLAPYLLKGIVVYVICRDVHIEVFDGKNGKGYSLTGVISDIEFASSKKQYDNQQTDMNQDNMKDIVDMDDDIPF